MYSLCRVTVSSGLQDSMVVQKNMMVGSTEESYVTEDVSIGLDSKPNSNDTEPLNLEENNRSCTVRLSDSSKEPQDMDVENCSFFPFQKTEKCQYIANSVQADKEQDTKNLSMQNYSEGSASADKVRNLPAQVTGFITFLLQCLYAPG